MSLANILNLEDKNKASVEVTDEVIRDHMPALRDAISFWREYPDLFVDQMLVKNNPENFKFFFYQRLYLRGCMRHKYFYATFSRGFSKSFLSILSLCLKAILFPRSSLFVSSSGKEQSQGILVEKMTLLCNLIPGISNEIDWRPGKTRTQKENARYWFKNGSTIEVLAASERSRGQRKNAGVLEECASMDGDILNQVLLPKWWGLIA